MKYFILLSFVSFLAIQSYAQQAQQYPEKLWYIEKAEKYRKMKTSGTVLAIGGGALMIVGIAVLENSSTETYYNGYTTETTTTGNPGLGAACFLLGAAGLGAGIPLWIVGAHSQEKYERRLSNLSVGFNINPQRTGLRLTYRF